MVNYVKTFESRTKLLLLAPIKVEEGRTLKEKLAVLTKQGYSRILEEGKVIRIEDAELEKLDEHHFILVVDRIIKKEDEDFFNRLADAVQEAFYEGKGEVYIEQLENHSRKTFNNKFELDGMEFLEPNEHLFSFNNPYGACPKCEGYGDVIGLDEELIFPIPNAQFMKEQSPPGTAKACNAIKIS